METIEQIKEDEGGYQAEVYLCTAGKLTWLYGRNIEDRPITVNEWLSLKMFLNDGESQKDWADSLFIAECNAIDEGLNYTARKYLENIPGGVWPILINMSYNMGLTKFNPSKWPKFFAAIKERDWKLAAAEGRNSQWFYQVGHRSARLMKSLAAVEYD